MKKVLSVLLAIAMIFSLVACNSASKITYTPGTYTATAPGHNGPLTVEVTVDKEAIKAIELKEHVETPGIGEVAFDKISNAIIEGQTLKVDSASGATISSAGIMTAITDALTQADGNIEALTAKEVEAVKAEKQTIDTDVVVIGSGASGISAAIEAAQGGAKVVVLEKLTRTGGSSRTSSGMVVAGGSDLQAEAGIKDSVEALKAYWLDRGEGDVDVNMVTYAADHALDSLQFLIDSGINYTPQGIIFSGTADVARAHIPATYGVEFMDKLIERAEALGVEIYTETPAESLIKDENNNIVGVNATQNGAEFIVNSKAVIIATGGFDHNEDLKAKYSPDAVGAWAVSAPQNTGDGLVMGMDVGADTVFKGGFIGWKVVSPAYGHTTMIGRPIYGAPNLIVDEKGSRFTDESKDYPFLYQAMVKNGSEKFYFVFDSKAADTTTLEAATATIESLEAAVEAGVAFKADTLDELQKVSGLANLAGTIETYNTVKASGTDGEFGRDTKTMSTIETGPYYVLQSQKATLGTFGGLKVNIPGNVLDKSGNAIPGLYAAGEVANGDFFNDTYPASGSSLAMCVIFGREAGKSAAEYIK